MLSGRTMGGMETLATPPFSGRCSVSAGVVGACFIGCCCCCGGDDDDDDDGCGCCDCGDADGSAFAVFGVVAGVVVDASATAAADVWPGTCFGGVTAPGFVLSNDD